MKKIIANQHEKMKDTHTNILDRFKPKDNYHGHLKQDGEEPHSVKAGIVSAVRILACNIEGHQRIYCTVFRLSHNTTFEGLFKKACEHWGIMEESYTLFAIDEDANAKNMQEFMKDSVLRWLD